MKIRQIIISSRAVYEQNNHEIMFCLSTKSYCTVTASSTKVIYRAERGMLEMFVYDLWKHEGGASTCDAGIMTGVASLAAIVGLAAAGFSPTTLAAWVISALGRSMHG